MATAVWPRTCAGSSVPRRHRFQLVGSIRDIRSNPDNPESEFADIHETAKSLNADKVVISLAERRGGFPLKQMLCCKIRESKSWTHPACTSASPKSCS